jgi:hypothetical protein
MPKSEHIPKWVSVKKFAEFYDLKPTFAYELVHSEGFPSRKIKKLWFVDMNKTEEYFDKYYKYA